MNIYQRLSVLASLPRQRARQGAVFAVLGLILALLGAVPVYATGALSFEATSTAPGTLQTGQTFDYLLNFSCSGVTGGCGNLEVVIPYDPSVVDIVNITSDLGAGYTNQVLTSPDRIVITKTGFIDGDSSQATIRFRARYNLPAGGTVPSADLTATITTPAGPPTLTETLTSRIIAPPTEQWSVNKNITQPQAPINPAVDSYARYNVQYCSDSATGNISIPNAVMVDVIPNGAVIRNAADIIAGGGVIDTVSTPNTIRWDLGNLDIATVQNGCITRVVELEFPSAAGFADTQVVGNTVYGYNGDPGTGPYDGTCIAPCASTGTFTRNATLSPPNATPQVVKNGPGTVVITNPGVDDFTFSFNTSQANVPLSNVILREDIPLAPTSGLPAFLITEIRSGAWSVTAPDVNPTAEVFYSTNNGGAWTSLGVVSGANVTWVGGTDYPDPSVTPITNIEWRFTSDIPMGFSFATAPRVLFTPNPNLDIGAGEYEDPAAGTQNYRSYQNCVDLTYSVGGTPNTIADTCAPARISNTGTANIQWSKGASPSSNLNGGDIVTFTLTMDLTAQSSGNLINPFFEDTLDGVLIPINWDNTDPITSAGQKFEVTYTGTDGSDTTSEPFISVSGQTIRFFWTADGAFPYTAGSFTRTGAANAGGETNPLNIIAPTTFGNEKQVRIRFRARLDPNAIAGGYNNSVTVATNSPGLFCQSGTGAVDTLDIDQDGDTTEIICNTQTNFSVREVATVDAYKWVRSTIDPTNHVREDRASVLNTFTTNPDFACVSPVGGDEVLRNALFPLDTTNPDFSRTPCVAQGNPGENFEYKLEIRNRGNIRINNFVLYDILPYIGDVGVGQATLSQPRLSEFQVWMTGPVSITPLSFAAAVEVRYSQSSNPCRPEMSNTVSETWNAPGCSSTWLTEAEAAAAGWNTIRSFRIQQTNQSVTIDPNQSITIDMTPRIPTHSELTAAGNNNEADRALVGEVAWNNYAYRFTSSTTGNRLLTAEPRKVGIRIPERLSVGNRLWIDNGGGTPSLANNRLRNQAAGEVGVVNALVQLYRWDGAGSPPAFPTDGSIPVGATLVADTNTDANGYYLFEIDERARGDFNGGTPTEAAYDWVEGSPVYSLRPDNYFIYIPPSNFDNDGDPLYAYISSSGVTADNADIRANADDTDKGIDNGLGALGSSQPEVNGVRSEWFTLQYPTVPLRTTNNSRLPLNEPDRLLDGTHGPYGRGNLFQRDGYSDLTRDFGFVRAMSIGNRVWYDTGTGANTNNGIFDAGELPVSGVTMRLYRVQQNGAGEPVYNGDGTPALQTGYFTGAGTIDTYSPVTIGGGGDYLQTTTDAQGYYQFEGLPEGNYVVFIPETNFTFATSITADAILATYASSTGNTATDGIANPSVPGTGGTFGNGDDSRDKGIDANFLGTNGVYSPVVHLRPVNSQTTDETDDGTRGSGVGIIDSNGNQTVDFGFYQPPMSLGNRVWRDYDNSGIQEAGEPGIAGVLVELYYDENGDGLPDNGASTPVNATLTAPGAPVATTTTNADGYYRFDNLRPGRYVVRIAPDNFIENGTNDVLVPFVNSTPTTATANVDMSDNGINPANVGIYQTEGIYSNTVQLIPNSEPNDTGGGNHTGTAGEERDDGIDTTANGTIGTNPLGQGSGGDRNSDLTVDFGFYRPSSIGNRVWIDDGNGTATDANGNPTGINDGVQNGNEATQGVQGVTMALYRFIGAGNPLTTPFNIADLTNFAFVRTTVTDAQGYYIFDGLPEQDAYYYVFIPPTNFDDVADPLYRHAKSIPQFTTDDDFNNNGVFYNFPVENGVVSNIIPVLPITEPSGWAPTGETELSANRSNDTTDATASGTNARGRFNEGDNFSDLTIDFSFYPERMSLGNRVWRDYNNNAQWDATEPGIAGVTLNLYTADGSGNPVQAAGSPLATTTTDSNGFYIFDNLLPGNYIVAVAPSNFNGGNVLENLTNSNNNNLGYNGADNQTDRDDNGVDAFDAAYGYRSVAVNLTYRTEPINDDELSNNPTHGEPGAPYENYMGRQLQRDDNSDLTIDFGFYRASSIGNRVWIDDGAGGGVYNDGVQNGNEPNQGVNGVNMELWRYTGSGTPPTFSPTVPFSTTDLTLVRTVQTTDGGFYLFDGLPEENATYYVRVRPDNFATGGALVNYDNSLPTFNDTTDRNDNGIYTNYPASTGVVSQPITVTTRDGGGNPVVSGWAPTNEHGAGGEVSTNTTLTGANGRGIHRETDDFSNLTQDFGFLTPRFSLGNRVWYDLNNNGVWDPAATSATGADEAGVPNVTVRLYRDDNNNGVFNRNAGDGLIATTTTDANGFYLFDNLEAGNYFVWIDELMFRSGAPLLNYYSSQPTALTDNNIDRDDNGEYVNVPAAGVKPAPEVNGVVSPMITLAKNTEPIGDASTAPNNEVELSNNPVHDDGSGTYRGNNRLDSNSNLTVDFGFYKPMSIGNRVWLDTDGDGIRDDGEPGIPAVQLQLWLDTNNDGNPDVEYQRNGTPYVVTTDVNGYYLFDNLTPGRYIVQIAGNQGALAGLNSTTDDINPASPPATVSGTGFTRTDNNDNGAGTGDTTTTIRSIVVPLVLDSEPTITSSPPETDIDPILGAGRNGEEDRNSNLTIDFGFTGQLMALGNRIWLDPNNNGRIDPTETGIQNVAVSLYRDVNNDGIPDGSAIATTTTDATGYYLFDNLAPGNYLVGLNNTNFNSGQPLNGLLSSTGNYADPVANSGGTFTRDDNRDNGIDTLNASYGLLSSTIALVRDQAPSNETGADSPTVGAGGNTNNSDLTRDFGLYRPLSLGNRIWLDPNNNGTQDATESGIPGVLVELLRDDGAGTLTPVLDSSGTPRTDTTDANGYYLFDGLGEGDYVVRVVASNFQTGGALVGLNSSTPTFADTTDRNDNGINDADPATNGIRSNTVQVRLNSNPTGESDLSNNPTDGATNGYRGNNGETDANSNLTVDFGFTGASMSLGDFIWFDEGAGANARNGVFDTDELGVPAGVRVSLYRDTDNNGTPDGAAVATTTTSAGGHYLFDGLAPGRYIVGLDAANFASGGLLLGYGSSPDPSPARADDQNNQDYGIDTSAPYLGNGIISRTITLQLNTEPSGETNTGPETNTATDPNNNLTVDFGLYRPLSLGNRVWFDTGAGVNTDNGIQDTGEQGIAGVTLALYRDDGSGALDGADTFVGTTTTDPNGYYLFDNLPEGNYFVVVQESNLATGGVLQGYSVSTPTFADAADRNNNGVATLPTYGVTSNLITLAYGANPTNESDLSGNAPDHGPNFRGRFGESDANSDLTIDFGFVAASMSLGNRVWLDNGDGGGTENNGTQDGTEPPVQGVTVQLFAADTSGNPVGSAIRTTTTDADGYYLFDNLPPGRYIVVLPPSNFQPGGVLLGTLSSTGDTSGTDTRDNGIDTPSPNSSGVRSPLITLVPNAAPTGEDEGTLGRGVDSNGDPLADENSNLTVDFGFVVRFDWGDNPDTGAVFTFPNANPANYGTSNANNGPRHRIVPGLYLGDTVDAEGDGQPSVGADGDDTNGTPDDEDGVNIPRFVANTVQEVQVKVFNNTGSDAYVVGWVDLNGNGVFDAGEAGWNDINRDGSIDGSEQRNILVPSSTEPQYVSLFFAVPNDADIATGGSTYARFRLTTDTSIFSGGDPANDPIPNGAVNDGEIEDYRVPEVAPPGLAVTKTNGTNSIVAGQFTEYTITVANSGAPLFGVSVVDDIFAQNTANALVAGSATWTCETFLFPTPPGPAADNPSCEAGISAPTANGSGAIAQAIDLPTYTGVRFRLRVQVSAAATAADAPIVNRAIVNSSSTPPVELGGSTDSDGIIFDPPFGTKTGQVIGGNIIRWTQVWLNTGASQTATISDVLPANQTFNGNLVCTAVGSSVTNSCVFDPATRTVAWNGTIDTGNNNRVEIAFDVIVPGDGDYTNTATISANGATASASNTVRIGNPTSAPGIGLQDPAIVKLVDPMFAQPGERVTWTITVTNPNNAGVSNVSVTDNMPPQLEILSASASIGTVTVNGQNITFNIDPLPANTTATITVNTRLRADVEGAVTVTNTALLYNGKTADATLVTVRELPATGESPWWHLPLMLTLSAVLGLGGIVGLAWRVYQRDAAR